MDEWRTVLFCPACGVEGVSFVVRELRNYVGASAVRVFMKCPNGDGWVVRLDSADHVAYLAIEEVGVFEDEE